MTATAPVTATAPAAGAVDTASQTEVAALEGAERGAAEGAHEASEVAALAEANEEASPSGHEDLGNESGSDSEHGASSDDDEHGRSADDASEHGASEHGASEHGAHGHVPHFSDINWIHGFLGEKDGPPSLLYRPPGMPVPFGALLLNSAILFYLLFRFGGPAIRGGLVSRKQRIAGDIEAAARMRQEAEKQLEHYEQKLHHMSTELERIMKETREQAASEHTRILEEAKVRRVLMEEEARQIVEHELAQARQEAISTLVALSIRNAATKIQAELGEADQQRLAQALVTNVASRLVKSEVRS